MTRLAASRMGLGRRVIGWIAAYALVLHATFAGMAVTQAAAAGRATHAFEICLTDPDAAANPAPHVQHQDCAIHCATATGGTPVSAAVAIALKFPTVAASAATYSEPAAPFALLRRDGLGSRAPPAA